MAIIKHNNQSISNVTAFPSAVPTGKLTLISTATASSSASIEFTSGIDSTYDVYQFEFININPANDFSNISFQGSTNGGSSYGLTITSTSFYAGHYENDTNAEVVYLASKDLAQSTSFQLLANDTGNLSDEHTSGSLYLFQPSSSVFVKHFIARMLTYNGANIAIDGYFAGYINDTNPVDAIKFQMSSGNFDGTIKMYGISA